MKPSHPCAGKLRRRRWTRKYPATRLATIAAVIPIPSFTIYVILTQLTECSVGYLPSRGTACRARMKKWHGQPNRGICVFLHQFLRQPPRAFLLCLPFFRGAKNEMSEPEKLERGLGLLEATSLNMTFMIGIGPFVVIPFIIRAMNGPQCILAWVVGAALALVGVCVGENLGAWVPKAGGSYVFLREAYGPNRFGRLMSFLFIWQTLFQGPLSISSGALGFADYSLYLTAKMATINAWLGAHPQQMLSALANYNRLVAILLIVIAIVLLYRRITAIGKISTILWMIAAATIAWLIYGGATHFNKDLVFTYPAGAWSFSWIFFAGLGHASVQAIYSYLGYYNVCNLGGEM